MELGVTPEAMLGHSLGEYVAACLAGVMSLEDALRLVIARGQLMQNMPPGVMLSVAAPEKALQELLQEHNEVVLAAVNAPSLCVVSGPPEEMLRFETQLADHGLEGHRLRTSHAFHSPMMTPVAGPLRDLLAGMKLRAPSIPFLSNLTGRWITAEQATNPDYWVNHLLHTVRFSDNLQHLLKQGRATLLEMGPDTLIVLAKRHPENNAENTFVASIKSRSKKEAEYLSFLHAVGTVWAHGSHILWDVLPREGKCKRVTLPTYPFERQRFNIPRAAGATAHYAIVNETDAIGQSQAVQPHYSTEKAPANTDSSGSLHHLVLGQLEVVARQLELLRQRIQ
jgi:acyl transferase domain-containing protein